MRIYDCASLTYDSHAPFVIDPSLGAKKFLSLAVETKGQTLYQFDKDERCRGRHGQTPCKKVKSVKKYEYKREAPPSPRAASPEEKGLEMYRRAPRI